MSLKCTVLKSGFCELTQGFGGGNNHRGLDLVDKGYTIGDIVSYGNGTVVMVTNGYRNGQGEGANWRYGNFVKILHDNGTVCLYAHMEYTSVKYNQRVSKGQLLGRMGNSGNSNGGHLHWEYWSSNNYNANIDPMPYLEPKPIITIPSPVNENKDINQIKVVCGNDTLRVRQNGNANGTFIGYVTPGLYNIISTANADGFTWYQVEKDKWFANADGCTQFIPKYVEPVVVEPTPIIEEPIIETPKQDEVVDVPKNDTDTPTVEDKEQDSTNTTEDTNKPKKGIVATILGIGGAITYYLQEHWIMLLVVAFTIILVATILYIKKRRNK